MAELRAGREQGAAYGNARAARSLITSTVSSTRCSQSVGSVACRRPQFLPVHGPQVLLIDGHLLTMSGRLCGRPACVALVFADYRRGGERWVTQRISGNVRRDHRRAAVLSGARYTS